MKDQTELVDHTEAAIRAVLAEETRAFYDRDWEAFANCWVQDARAINIHMSHDYGLESHHGWQAISAVMAPFFEETDFVAPITWSQDEIEVHCDGDTAWALFIARNDDPFCRTPETLESRVLEREDGQWRIVYLSSLSRRSFQRSDDRVALDSKGRILSATTVARERLEAHPALTVSRGRLRASRPGADKVLQAALANAARFHDGFYYREEALEHLEGKRFALPLVFEDDETGRFLVCLITVEDGVTYVSLGTDADVRRRVEAAGLLFGLSDGQLSLAHGIVAGAALPELATGAGVSPNTLRTQLSRIYAKTGVNSQSALVRLLLSVS